MTRQQKSNQTSSSLFSDSENSGTTVDIARQILHQRNKSRLRILIWLLPAILLIAGIIIGTVAYVNKARINAMLKEQEANEEARKHANDDYTPKMIIEVKGGMDGYAAMHDDYKSIIRQAVNSKPSEIKVEDKGVDFNNPNPQPLTVTINGKSIEGDKDFDGLARLINEAHAEIFGEVLFPLEVKLEDSVREQKKREEEERIRQEEARRNQEIANPAPPDAVGRELGKEINLPDIH